MNEFKKSNYKVIWVLFLIMLITFSIIFSKNLFSNDIVNIVDAQIVGGTETIKFEPGDITLFADDFSSLSIGGVALNLKLVKGTYEIAEFQGKKWIRPLDTGLAIAKPLKLPKEFSVEFTFYAFEDGRPWMNFYLLPSKSLQEWSSEGGERFLQLQVGYNDASFWVSDKPTYYKGDNIRIQSLKPNQLHKVSLEVREGQVSLFIDDQRVAITPFNPESSIEGIGFYWYKTYETKTPYRDAPVLLTDLRVSKYSSREKSKIMDNQKVKVYLIINKNKIGKYHPLLKTLKDFGAIETNKGWELPLPNDPFQESGSWEVKLDSQTFAEWIKTLKNILSQANKLDSNTYLLIEGFAYEVNKSTKNTDTENNGNNKNNEATKNYEGFWEHQGEFWLAGLRARALAIYLAQNGIEIKNIKTAP